MKITVEFTGIARTIVGEHEIQVDVAEDISYCDIVRRLGENYPGLIGPIINPADPDLLINSTIFSRNGEDIITLDQMPDCPRDGDRLILLTVIVGGAGPAVWTEETSVRSFETDFAERWKPACFFQAMQEAATHHAAAFGFPYREMLARDMIWVLSRMKIYFHRFPRLHEVVRIETWPKGIQQRLFFMRDFCFTSPEGEPYASATSAWLLIDPQARRILPPRALYGEVPDNAGRSVIEETLEKIQPPEGMTERLRRQAGFSAVDLMGHVNNARYIEWIADLFPLDSYRERDLAWLQINYINEVRPGEEVVLAAECSDSDPAVWQILATN
ncbi:MAG TPA: acyl-ACP thioesterase domain-containing protein, partial [Anaerolineaceae bacterium]|nr:acyl-ACP thioesterase domain-containing protein [Anaerolineaceae bacterium]